MACCAFAIFVFGQLYVAIGMVRTFVLGQDGFETAPRPNAAIAWRLGAEASPKPRRRGLSVHVPRLTPGRGTTALALSATAALVFAFVTRPAEAVEHLNHALQYAANICGEK